MHVIVITVVLAGVALVRSQVPIPNRPLGYVYNGVSANAPVHIEFFLDLVCPDCKVAFPVLKSVGDHYGNSVRIAAIPFPLPFHRNAFLAAKGIHVVKNMTDGSLTTIYDWMAEIFANQEKFGENTNYNVPENDTVGIYASIAGKMGLSVATFTRLLISDMSVDWNTRVEWKYGCSRGVAGTPWFTVNGVIVAADQSWTLSDWIQLIDPLLANTRAHDKKSVLEDCQQGTKRCEYLPGKVECCTAGENCVPNVGCRC